MSVADQVLKLKRKVDELKEKQLRNKIIRERVIKELKDIGCDTVEDAEKEIKRLDKEILSEDKNLETLYNEFIEQYGQQLGIDCE